MQTMNLLQKLSITELKEKYRSLEVTPEYIIEEILKRTEQYQDYHIWITPPTKEAIQPYLEHLKDMDPQQAPLWGIPFAIKDNIDLQGVPTTAGCPMFAYTPSDHATVVQRLVDAGAIPIGKTNLDQFATGLVGTRSPYGETKNALNPDLISGGSSSGSAVAVACGLASFALGTDTAGSGRVPAALNRLVGYKSSLGAWPVKGVVPACASLDCVSVFTHELSDAMLIDEVVRGFEASDPWSKQITRHRDALPEKIYILEKPLTFYGPFADQYKAAWAATIERIQQFNIPIEYIDGSYLSEAAAILYDGPWVAERWADLGEFVTANKAAVFPVTETVLESATKSGYDAASVFNAIHRLQALKQRARQQLQNAVLIMPTAGGTWTREEVRRNPIDTNSLMGLYTNHCNLLDLCAIALPGEDIERNLPFGITLFSSSINEHLISGLADALMYGKYPEKQRKTVLLAVCGLHMRGFELESQMLEHGAVFVRQTKSAPVYRMIKLPSDPPKPGLMRSNNKQGTAIELELWEMPIEKVGHFMTNIPAPLGIGKVLLEDESEVLGFICEANALEIGEDISYTGGWRYLK